MGTLFLCPREKCAVTENGTNRRPQTNREVHLVREAGVEPTTFGSGGRRSIQLSYSRNRIVATDLSRSQTTSRLPLETRHRNPITQVQTRPRLNHNRERFPATSLQTCNGSEHPAPTMHFPDEGASKTSNCVVRVDSRVNVTLGGGPSVGVDSRSRSPSIVKNCGAFAQASDLLTRGIRVGCGA